MSVEISEERCVDIEDHDGRNYYDVYEEEIKDIVEDNDLESHSVREIDDYDLYYGRGRTHSVMDIDKVVLCHSDGNYDEWMRDDSDSTYSYYVYDCRDVYIDNNSIKLHYSGETVRISGRVISIYQNVSLDDLISKEAKIEGTTRLERIHLLEVLSDCDNWEVVYGDKCVDAAYHKCENRGFIRGEGEFEDYSEWVSSSVSKSI
jgi:hypothetical protein